eukprot:5329352-Pyramimonas_sp.AAC.1
MPLQPVVPEWRVVDVVAGVVVLEKYLSAQRQCAAPPPPIPKAFSRASRPRTKEKPTSFTI